MACQSNAASTMDNWLSSKNSHDQTIRAHMEKDITSEASNRGIVATIHCIALRDN